MVRLASFDSLMVKIPEGASVTEKDRYQPSSGKQSEDTSRTDLWIERDLSSGRFVKDKESGGSFKGIRRER